jgi:hypothetical protein
VLIFAGFLNFPDRNGSDVAARHRYVRDRTTLAVHAAQNFFAARRRNDGMNNP